MRPGEGLLSDHKEALNSGGGNGSSCPLTAIATKTRVTARSDGRGGRSVPRNEGAEKRQERKLTLADQPKSTPRFWRFLHRQSSLYIQQTPLSPPTTPS